MSTIAPTPTIIHRNARLAGERAGTVQRDGRTLGVVRHHARPNRPQGQAWTADPINTARSLGTRYPSRHAAVAALVAFDRYCTTMREHRASAAIQCDTSGWLTPQTAPWLRSVARARVATDFLTTYDRGF